MSQTESRSEHIKKLGELIKDVKFAMLTTVDDDGTLRSRPMATQKAEFDGNLWFFTYYDSAKSHEIEKDQHVNASYANPDDNTWVSVSGMARVLRDQEKAKELWNPILKAYFPKGLEDPNLALLKVDVNKAEYWDAPSSSMVTLFGYVKAIATGKKYEGEGSEHEKVTL